MTRKSLIPPPETGKETRVATGGRATAPGPTHLPRGGGRGGSAQQGRAKPLSTQPVPREWSQNDLSFPEWKGGWLLGSGWLLLRIS